MHAGPALQQSQSPVLTLALQVSSLPGRMIQRFPLEMVIAGGEMNSVRFESQFGENLERKILNEELKFAMS